MSASGAGFIQICPGQAVSVKGQVKVMSGLKRNNFSRGKSDTGEFAYFCSSVKQTHSAKDAF